MSTHRVVLTSFVYVTGLVLTMLGALCLIGMGTRTPSAYLPLRETLFAAVAFVTLGAGLLCDLHRLPLLRAGAGVILVGISLALAYERLQGHAPATPALATPFDEPGCAVVLAWLLLGVEAIIGRRNRRWLRQTAALLPLVALAVVGVALIGQMFPAAPLPRLHAHEPLSLTVDLFTLLAAGAWVTLSRLPARAHVELSGRLLAVGILGAATCSAAWAALWLQEYQSTRLRGALLLDQTAERVQTSIAEQVSMLRRMAERWSAADAVPTAGRWEVEATGHLRDFPSVDVVAVISPGLETASMRHRTPAPPHWLGAFLAQNDTREWLRAVMADDATVLSHVIGLSGQTRHAVVAGLNSPSLHGWAVLAVANPGTLLGQHLDKWSRGLAVRVRQDEQVLYEDPRLSTGAVAVGTRTLHLAGGGEWQVDALHVPLLHPQRGLLANSALLAGIAFLVTLLVSLRQAQLTRRDAALVANQRDTLAAIAHSDDLATQLVAICTMTEALNAQASCAIHETEPGGIGLRLAAAPSLSPTLRSALAELPAPGLSGSAASHTTLENPPWPRGARDALAAAGYTTVLAQPLISPDGKLLGQASLLLSAASQDFDLRLLNDAAQYAAIALERVRARAELQQGEQRYRSLVAFNPDAVFSVDLKARISSCNPATQRLFGLSEGELLGRAVREFVVPADQPEVSAMFRRTLAGNAQHLQVTGVNHHGVTFETEATTVPISVDSAFVGIFVIAKDITERRRIERALQERTQFFLLSPEMLGMVNHAGVLLQVNPAFARVTGYRAESVVGRQLTDLIHEDDRTLLDNALRRLGRGESIYDLDLRGNHRDGHVIWMRIRAALGSDDAIYLAAREITEEIRVTRDLARKERSFRQLLDDNRDALLVVSPQGRVQYANPAARTLLGAALGRRGAELAELASRRGADTTLFEWPLEGPHGETIDVEVLGSETDWDGTQMRLLSLRDVRLRKASEEELRVLKRALQASHNAVMIIDARTPGSPLIYANPAFGRITGYPPSETVGRNLSFLYGSATDRTQIEGIEHRLRQEQDVHAVMLNYRKDGSTFWCDLYIAPVRDGQGAVTHYICILRDVTDEKEAEAQLSHIANHDLLTDLPNRRMLEQRLNELGRVPQAVGQGMAVVFVDLDGFKPINDSMGHVVGDAILVEVARRMRENVRPRDLVARLSGDEFIVVLFDVQREQAERMTQRLIGAIAQPYEIMGGNQHITASAGITYVGHALDDPMSLVQEADLAMYKAKHEGRNNFQWHSRDMSERVHERVRLRNELRAALATSQLQLHYQPKFERVTGKVAGIEALARWNHPERGAVPPSEFIKVAEETGQIVALGAWALETACSHNQWLYSQGLSNFCVAVNISPMQFQRRDFTSGLKDTLRRTGLPAYALELEITESVLLEDTESVIATLHELKELGVRVSIDDFGTGFSSLSYLKNLPIDYVKIDRSFVRDINIDGNDAAISKAIISMAHNLGLRVVAEGVETEAQLEFLKRNRCDEFQGYFLARPMPLDDLVRFLERMGNLN
ncbi:EAL domain-containing protein [Verticiella sediminum]|uniref:EAL domain-containing protein n=1 Tax=Verticiella sediminum TaxID=1247510 RepID=A0A556B0D4_9BURK|nr:EAL domain-containing protein [Verticiella sediminum]TSH98647.1 EAL domain-containing protein [Verticiella sediminum]